MLSLKVESEKLIRVWQWPVIVIVVIVVLVGIQMLRVNKPAPPVQEVVAYSTPGPVVSGDLVIPAGDYFSTRIRLNRRAKLSGEFRTRDLKTRVAVLVLTEENFEGWRMNGSYLAAAQTGYVPGGRVSPVLAPGTYFLVLDNRTNNTPGLVHAEFQLQ